MKISKIIQLICIVSICLFSCHTKTKKQTASTVETVEKITDPSFLFDGVSLDGWEVANFPLSGRVYVKNGEIVMEMGDGCTGITWTGFPPVMEYRISLDAKRIEGHDFFCGLTFPVNDDFCTLILGGWAGAVVGISCIDRRDASENETTRMMYFEDNRWYHISVEVAGGKIIATVDKQVVVDFTIGNHRLSIRPEVDLSIPLGIASWRTGAALKNIRMEEIY